MLTRTTAGQDFAKKEKKNYYTNSKPLCWFGIVEQKKSTSGPTPRSLCFVTIAHEPPPPRPAYGFLIRNHGGGDRGHELTMAQKANLARNRPR